MVSGRWEGVARPELAPPALALWRAGREHLAAGRTALAGESLKAGAEQARAAGDALAAAWWFYSLARALSSPADAAEAKAGFAAAVELVEPLGNPSLTALLLRRQANHLDDLEEVKAAEALLARAFKLEDGLDPPRLSRADTLSLHAAVVGSRGRLDEAGALLLRAQTILEAEAPVSLPLAEVLNRLGIVAYRGERLELARERLSRADALFEQLDPGGGGHVLAVSNLGVLARLAGDYAASEAFYRRALAMAERLDPNGRQLVGPLTNIGTVLIGRGDLAEAETTYLRALEIAERTEAENLNRATILVHLGNIAQNRGELGQAERYLRQALAIEQRVAPDHTLVTQTMSNLGTVLSERQDFSAARKLFTRVLAIEEAAERELNGAPVTLANLAKLELDSGGDLNLAERYLSRAFEVLARHNGESVQLSGVLIYQSELAMRKQRHQEAVELASRALELRNRFAQGSFQHAEAVHRLGQAEVALGRLEQGAEHLCQALTVLDQQRRRVGSGAGSRLTFEAALSKFHHACLEARLRQGRPEDAFQVGERGRARGFLSLLAERDLLVAELPAELAVRRNRLDLEVDRVISALARLSVESQAGELDKLLARQVELRQQREAILTELRQSAPRFANLEYPKPLNLAEVRASLDPGTVMLSYSVGERATRLFVVTSAEIAGSGLEVLKLPIGEEPLRQSIARFRRQLAAPPEAGKSALEASLRELYELLLQPVEASLAKAGRLLVIPDGPLHSLPFAALLWGGARTVAGKPLHLALSATVYAELKRLRPTMPRPPSRLVAFGDPRYPPVEARRTESGEVARWSPRLEPLPESRREVESIAALFPGARVFLGDEAREETVRKEGPSADILHFACHGWTDEREPLSSTLALSPSGATAQPGENGLLQAWEIFERLRLSADLVTLSACDTALGKEMGGEGLVGLTRAFQFAGARSVLASLWQVSDASTGELMRRFYGHLRQGLPKDEALAAAQRELAQSADPLLAHPHHWAAFQLYGDWM